MRLHFTSSTVQAYENKEGSMDLFFNPIIIFEDIIPSQLENLQDLQVTINSKEIGEHIFSIEQIKAATIKAPEDQIYVEFKLSLRNIVFIYDNYACEVCFSTNLKGKVYKKEALGIVKTKWSKGLV